MAKKSKEDMQGDRYPDELFDANQLAKGTEHEMEHTTSPEEAKKTAKDHLLEIPDYYDRLQQMENEAKQLEEKMDNIKQKDNPIQASPQNANNPRRIGPGAKIKDKDADEIQKVRIEENLEKEIEECSKKVASALVKKPEAEDSIDDYLANSKEFMHYVPKFKESKKYIKNPAEAPEGANVQQGPRGGYFYDSDGAGKPASEPEPKDTRDPDYEPIDYTGVNTTGLPMDDEEILNHVFSPYGSLSEEQELEYLQGIKNGIQNTKDWVKAAQQDGVSPSEIKQEVNDSVEEILGRYIENPKIKAAIKKAILGGKPSASKPSVEPEQSEDFKTFVADVSREIADRDGLYANDISEYTKALLDPAEDYDALMGGINSMIEDIEEAYVDDYGFDEADLPALDKALRGKFQSAFRQRGLELDLSNTPDARSKNISNRVYQMSQDPTKLGHMLDPKSMFDDIAKGNKTRGEPSGGGDKEYSKDLKAQIKFAGYNKFPVGTKVNLFSGDESGMSKMGDEEGTFTVKDFKLDDEGELYIQLTDDETGKDHWQHSGDTGMSKAK
jgi:hypothetical protein